MFKDSESLSEQSKSVFRLSLYLQIVFDVRNDGEILKSFCLLQFELKSYKHTIPHLSVRISLNTRTIYKCIYMQESEPHNVSSISLICVHTIIILSSDKNKIIKIQKKNNIVSSTSWRYLYFIGLISKKKICIFFIKIKITQPIYEFYLRTTIYILYFE